MKPRHSCCGIFRNAVARFIKLTQGVICEIVPLSGKLFQHGKRPRIALGGNSSQMVNIALLKVPQIA